MESASLKLNENFPLCGLGSMSPQAPLSTSLPVDPWLTPPIQGAATMAALPSFLAHAALGTPGLITLTPDPTDTDSTTTTSSADTPVSYPCRPPPVSLQGMSSVMHEVDPRSSSIVALRMRAKEHMENLSGMGGFMALHQRQVGLHAQSAQHWP